VLVVTARQRVSPEFQQAQRAYSLDIPMDVVASDCMRIFAWFRGKLDIHVTPPSVDRMAKLHARCKGGRLVNVRDRYGAYIVYELDNGRHMNVLVYDGQGDDMNAPRRKNVRGVDVYLDSARGASTAGFRGRDGLHWLVTSDLDEDALSNVVEAAFQPAVVQQ
jgi:hypothetical protein